MLGLVLLRLSKSVSQLQIFLAKLKQTKTAVLGFSIDGFETEQP